MSNDHKFHLLENALDYVLSAAEHAALNTHRGLKYAVLHLFAGVELLLKAKLKEEHWSLLFADVDKASYARLESGDFKSVDFDTAASRLQELADVEIRREDLVVLRTLKGLRNKIQHFGGTINVAQVQSQIGYVANFVIEFVKENLPDLEAEHAAGIRRTREILNEQQAFIDERMKSLERVLDGFKCVEDCPYCVQQAVPIGVDDPPRCRFCDTDVDPAHIAAGKSETQEVYKCLDCGRNTCAMILVNNDETGYQCYACGKQMRGADYEACPRCRSCVIAVGDGLCGTCYSELGSQGD